MVKFLWRGLHFRSSWDTRRLEEQERLGSTDEQVYDINKYKVKQIQQVNERHGQLQQQYLEMRTVRSKTYRPNGRLLSLSGTYVPLGYTDKLSESLQ